MFCLFLIRNFSLVNSFSGFPEEDDKDSRAVRTKKLESKKWTMAALKDLCTLIGLEKGGDKVSNSRSANVTSIFSSPTSSAPHNYFGTFFCYSFCSLMI